MSTSASSVRIEREHMRLGLEGLDRRACLTPAVTAPTADEIDGGPLIALSVELLRPHPLSTAICGDGADLHLVEEIGKYGLIHSVVVTRRGDEYLLLPRSYLLAWVKPNPAPSVRKRGWRSTLERIVYAPEPGPDTFNFFTAEEMTSALTLGQPGSSGRGRPFQKARGLLKRLVEVAAVRSDEVQDPFAGYGSTDEAAFLPHRHALVIALPAQPSPQARGAGGGSGSRRPPAAAAGAEPLMPRWLQTVKSEEAVCAPFPRPSISRAATTVVAQGAGHDP